jgi:hypothetical protein
MRGHMSVGIIIFTDIRPQSGSNKLYLNDIDSSIANING